MATCKDGTGLYAVERHVRYGERPGFRISELQIGPTHEVPWPAHAQAQDTFYVLEGRIRLSLREPDEDRQLRRGDIVAVSPGRPHRVTNGGDTSATFLVLQNGDYDYVPALIHGRKAPHGMSMAVSSRRPGPRPRMGDGRRGRHVCRGSLTG